MDVRKGFKRMRLEKDMTQTQVGEKLGMSGSNASRFFLRKDFRVYEDVARVADAMGYDVKLSFVDRETGKEIDCD